MASSLNHHNSDNCNQYKMENFKRSAKSDGSRQISGFPIDVNQLPKYGAANVIAYCLCMTIFYEGLIYS